MHFFILFLTGVVFFYSFHYFPFSTVGVSLLSSVYLTIRKKFFLIIILFLGVTYAFFRYEPSRDIPYIKESIAARGSFQSYPVSTDRGTFRQTFAVDSAINSDTNEKINELSGRDIVLFSEKMFEPGTEYGLALRLLKSRKRLNPGGQMHDEISANLLNIHHSGNKNKTLYIKIQEYRQKIYQYMEDNFRKDSGSFLASITTGQMTYMDQKLRDAFSVTGLAHILSISGTHFGLFSVFLFGVFRFLINRLPYRVLQRITLFLTPSQAAAILCLPFMLAYLGLSGASIPAIRSFIMIGLFLVGLVIGRKGFWLNSVLFAAFLLVLWEPEYMFTLSFQLSFLAVLFIGFSVQTRDDDKKEKENKKFIRSIKNALLMSLSASIGTAPVVAYYFHYFSVISPISNLFIAPIIGFLLIPLSVIASFLYLLTGYFLFTPVVSLIADASIYLVRLFSAIPFADIKIPAFPPVVILLFYAGFFFYFLFRRKRYLLVIPFIPVLLYLGISVFDKRELTITFLDVGQGDSSVIELPDGKTMVIDTGMTGRETASFLKYRAKTTIDYLVLSHVHPDHTGGLDSLADGFQIKEIWENGRMMLPDALNHIKRHSFMRGDMMEGKDYTIHVLHPYPEFYTMNRNEYVGANNDSLVFRIEGKSKSFLFTGDIEEEAEENLQHLGRWLHADVIKVPHHGAKTSAYEPFFRTASPDIAVISVGRDNPFGHPHQELLNTLSKVRIFRTDLDGAVKTKEIEQDLEIKTFRAFQFEEARSLHEEIKNIKRLFETW